ncbi:MAG: CBS domain-containing protein [Candidatus Binataceae bacterium]
MNGVQAGVDLGTFAQSVADSDRHAVFPVYEGTRAVGMVAVWKLSTIGPEQWPSLKVADTADFDVPRVAPDCELMEALKLLGREEGELLLVVDEDGTLEGVIGKTDILRALQTRGIARVRESPAPGRLPS